MSQYTPNEKRLKMFGAQTQGYSMERVDMYLDKLEGAYTQLRNAYEQLKTALPQAAGDDSQAQELIELNANLQQEAQTLRNENDALKAKAAEVEERVAQLNAEQSRHTESAESTIARALLSAQEKAEEILRSAQLEAQGLLATAHNQVSQLQAEKIRACKQLEGIRYSLEGILANCKADGSSEVNNSLLGLDL